MRLKGNPSVYIFSRAANNMARVPCSNILISFVLCLSLTLADDIQDNYAPEFHNLKIINTTHNGNSTEVLFEVRGRNIVHGLQIKTTISLDKKNSVCREDYNYTVSEKFANDFTIGRYVFTVPRNVYGVFYLCLPHNNTNHDGKMPPSPLKGAPYNWVHQGPNISINVPFDAETEFKG